MMLFGIQAFSQESTEEKLLLIKANELVFSDPDETIKIANHLLKKDFSESNKALLNLLLANSYKAKGDLQKSTTYIFEAGSNKKISDSLTVEVDFVKADLCRKLQLYGQMEIYLNNVSERVSSINNNDYIRSVSVRSELERAEALLLQKNYNASLKLIDKAESDNKNIADAYSCNANLMLIKGIVLNYLGRPTESGNYFKQAFDFYIKQRRPNTVFEIKVLLGTGQMYFAQKKYDKALDVQLLALQKVERLNNPLLKEIVTYHLAECCLAMDNKIDHQKYFSSFLTINDLNINMENEAVNTIYSLLNKEQDIIFTQEESSLKFITYVGLILILTLALAGVVIYRINRSKRRQLKEIIGYLEVSNKLLIQSDSGKKEVNKRITISTETENVILAKLKKFEASTKYINKDMSLATLAAQLDVNTKYLSEIINKHYNDNFNAYINKLRINYIIEKLKNEPEYLNYKISYLAEESGFSSHSSFATVFKTITGIAPTVFIDLIGKEVTEKKA